MAFLNQSQKDAAGLLTLGINVKKASATVPQGTTQDLFVVTGGNVLVNLMYGQVTTILGATANNISVNSNPTATGTTYIIASAIEGNALEANSFMVVEGDGTALMITGKAGAGPIISGNGCWICPPGVITFECVASTTGATKWELFYLPLEDGASVASA
jgi:hypothetical protein